MSVFILVLCYFQSFCFFSPLYIAITSLFEERAYLSAFRMFVQFVLVFFLYSFFVCLLFLFVSGKGCGL